MAQIIIGEGFWGTIYGYLNSMFAELYAAIASISGTNTGDNAVNTLYSGLAASKQDTLVSGTNIKTINGVTVLGSGDIPIVGAFGDVTGPAGVVANNVAVFDGVSGKVIKDGGGSVTGVNTGDDAVNTLYSGLVTNANHSGDASGSGVLTLKTVNLSPGTFVHATITVDAQGRVTAASTSVRACPYLGTVDLVAGVETVKVTTCPNAPYSILMIDSTGRALSNDMIKKRELVGGVFELTIYSAETLTGVSIYIIYFA